ncbi:type II secretion system protein N [Ferrimonas senticii]|uniref:type II secretion system protein N n=1 Tax=Ferrimonas senticii TaxID=394566 RepID=UPI000428E022|nr:type II secretion system protein N [Ferrimonas senticii]
MKRAVIYGISGLLFFLLCLLVTAPAAWLWQLLPNKPKQVQVSEISGSLWQGRIGYLKIAGRELEQITWQLHPSALLTGKLSASVSVDGALVQGKGDVGYGFSGAEAEGLRLQAPLTWLVGNQRLPFRTKLAGSVTLNARTFSQGGPWCSQLQGRLLVNGLDVNNQFGAYPLGDIAANLRCDNGELVVDVDGSENRIGVAGELRLQADAQVQVAATITETAEQPESLRQALPFLGKANAAGVYPLNYNGRIPGL